MIAVAAGVVGGALGFGLGSDEAYTPTEAELSWGAPRPRWTDAELGCTKVKRLIESYGKDGAALPFSEVGWLSQLVDATEVAGATEYDHGPTWTEAEDAVGYEATQLRLVAIGGGLSHPQFATTLTSFTDACDAHF